MQEQEKAQIKKTAKHSAIYAAGNILRRLTGLVMLPIYTRYLTPADYGAIELLSMAIEIAGILVGFRISQALFRFYILADNDDEKRVIVSTVLLSIIATSLLGAAFLYFLAEPATVLIFGDATYVFEFRLFAFTLITNAISAVGLSYLRAIQKPLLFVSINIITLAIQVALNIHYVVILEMHVTGVVYASLISGTIVAVCLSLYVLFHVGLGYSIDLAGKLAIYVSPLIFASIGMFYVGYADKYFLRLFGSLSDVGLYALAGRVSSVVEAVTDAFNLSWSADRFEIIKKDNANVIYEQVFRFLTAFLMLVGGGLALFANDFFRVMSSEAFYNAGYIVPFLVVASIIRVFTIYCNFGALYKGRTSIIAKAAWIKVAAASIFYLALIPEFGVYGAGIALVLSNLFELFWIYIKSREIYDMELNWSPVLIMSSITVLCVSIGIMLPQGELLWFAVRLVIFVSMAFTIYKLPLWSDSEITMINNGVMRIARLGRNA